MDTQKDKATPRPWKYDENGVITNMGSSIATTFQVAWENSRATKEHNQNMIDEQKANASLIVKSVNNHDALLEACKEAIEIIESLEGTDEAALHILRQAINQATK